MSKFDEYGIVPAVVSNIRHRAEECLPYYDAFWSDDADGWSLCGAHLPIFASPMACVIDDKNYLEFDKNCINPVIPRTVPFDTRLEISKQMIWIAMGLDEFENFINANNKLDEERYICVDIANGHMQKLIDVCKKAKEKFGDSLILMTGNIANPDTYLEYAKVGIDFCRLSIGSGGACATNDLTGISYNPINLIRETYLNKINVEKAILNDTKEYKSIPMIVQDGGCSSIRDIILALALGADYVMCGKIFAKAEEAAGEIINAPTPKRLYYGMSTERAQHEMGNTKIKSSEGYEKYVDVEYKLKDWTTQFVAAICSTMSYCNCTMLEQFIGKVNIKLL